MTTNTIITIGRQLGSGGREIGQMLAKDLGIKYYDKELLTAAAKESGMAQELSKIMTRSRPTVSSTLWLWIRILWGIPRERLTKCR